LKHALLHAVGISLVLLTLTACGGGSSTMSGSTSSTISSVSLACTPSTIAAAATSQCSATVMGSGSYSSAVTWSASAGTINASGLLTAPASAGTVTVTAMSMQDSTKAGTASVTVQAPPPPSSTITSVQVACTPAAVNISATSQCTATVKGTGSYSSAVTWSASAGAINATGLFTAPAAAASVTITATSVQDTAQSGSATIAVQSQTSQTRHIVMVMEENTSYSAVVRNTSAWPNLNNLISNGALATNYYANSHPSIGDYFMLTTGQLLTTDDNSTKVWDVDNIARRMLAANVPFRIYAEGITQGYVGGNTGLYLIRHNPFAMLSDIAGNPQVANQTIWPFTQFATDLANGTLPEFSFIVPNVIDDAHSGPPQVADLWLQTNVVIPVSNSPAFAPGGDGVLIVGFDEAATSDATHGGGHVACVFWGPVAKTGYTQTSSTLYQHQSMLRTVMDELSLPNPPGAAAAAPSMSEFLQK
jgi:phosphatidylinositol-3-phosphatase